MRNYLRNPEIRREILFYSVADIAFCVVGLIFGTVCGIILTGACLSFTAAHFISSFRRYRKIRALGESVDRVLHGVDSVQICGCAEGELAVLQSEIRKVTIRLRESADSLKKDKLRLTDSIADISHQLRTPLTSLNLIASLLSSSELSDEKRRSLTRDLKKQLSHIDWLVETLLKISKIDAGTAVFGKSPVTVSELLSKAAEPLAVPMELRGQTLDVSVGGERFEGDLAWSAEAVGNILKNCGEHTPYGGRIEVTAIETALFTEIKIRDTGPGIEKEDLPRLFERFYKGKNAAESSFGIGLALCRMIVTAQNGTVKAENHPDGGAVFTVRFYKGVI